MKRIAVLFLLAVGCIAPQRPAAKPVVDDYAPLVCQPVKPYLIHATPIHRARIATNECRLASYWNIVDGRWVAK